MSWDKRLFDIFFALLLGVVLLPVILGIALWIRLRDGAPVFYLSERMKTPEEGFMLVKFRTMRVVAEDSGVSGGDKAGRVTRTGRVLRRTRADELPQLWNVLKGDISFVGPRPPLRQYVERFPDLYREVLKSRPGITGLATLVYHGHEEWLLSRCRTTEETDAVYSRACVPRKARLDLIYRENRSFCFDLVLMGRTAARK
ncbi:sugar transferase [Histidinibacterium aquaticum]|uniref:Sugar transferase n=1 Tax=Histidinibacterium aquaticum TaxID=2613962 RepID=A0A5J5GQA9_9RHOB|nr:sugar transferase [Histidinibacterium aquaticum]KAA9010370.1 sugar transferase [Histidinibacterium aquaticum]